MEYVDKTKISGEIPKETHRKMQIIKAFTKEKLESQIERYVVEGTEKAHKKMKLTL